MDRPAVLPSLSVEDVLGTIAEAFFLLDASWRFVHINARAEALLGAQAHELLGRHIWQAYPEGVGSTYHVQYARSYAEGCAVAFSEFFPPLNRWFQVRAVPARGGLAVTFHDVTDLKRAEERAARLAEAQAALREVATAVAGETPVEALHELVCEVSARLVQGRGAWLVRYTDAGTYRVLAATTRGEGMPGRGAERSVLPGSEADVVRSTGRAVWSGDEAGGRFASYGTPAALMQPVRVAGRVWGAVVVAWSAPREPGPEGVWIADLADLVGLGLANAEARAELSVRAATDALTGLGNLRTLQSALDERIDRGAPVTLALLDVDHFKAVNDGFGHDAGDGVLGTIAHALRRHCRDEDLAARIGGDEFALVLAGMTQKEALVIVERIRAEVSRPGDGPQVTLSAGVCAWEPGLSREAVQRRADDALYAAKLHGRDAARAYDAARMPGLDPERRAVALRRAQEELAFRAQLVDKLPAAIVIADLDGLVLEFNRAAERLFGCTRADALGHHVADFIVEDETDCLTGLTGSACCNGLAGEGTARDRAGRTFPVDLRAEVLTGADREPIGTIAVVVDATERRDARRTLEVARDHLRTVTASIGDGLLVLAGDGRVSSANDAAGALLGCASERLVGRPAADALYGGNPVTPRLVGAAGETVRVEDDVFVRANGSALPVGWTSAPLATGEEGRVVIFRDATARREQEVRLRREADGLRWAGRIRDALDGGRFVLFAQPIIDLASGAVRHHELLIRLRDGAGGDIAPGAFLPAAEEHGLMTGIDAWVLEEAVEVAGRGLAVHVNVSAQSIGEPAILDALRRALARTGVDPSQITVELTETALTRDAEAARTFAEQLHGLGCRLALDDFGTGYNSLGRLKEFAVDGLKIDMQFVRDLLNASSSESVVKAIVTLAAEIGVPTVAEGVEDEHTAARLRALGVTFGQGYLFGAPAALPEPEEPAAAIPFRMGLAAPR